MHPQLGLVKLTICGPGDVAKEVAIAKEVVDEWNRHHGETRGVWIKHQHWSTDAYPDLSDRAQAVINREIIDGSDVLVAVFWSRFGTPTGVVASGTEEEIRRGVQLCRKVLVYFSDLEPLPAGAETGQLSRLGQFRQALYGRGLCWSFRSRAQFRKDFTNHLALLLNEFKPRTVPKKAARKPQARTSQTAKGKNILQVGGNIGKLTVHHQPPVVKNVMERRPGSVTSQEAFQIHTWIEALVEGEVGITRKDAFGMWWSRFYNRFQVEKYEELPSSEIEAVAAWYREQVAIQKDGLKSKAPDLWRTDRIRAIKAAMTEMAIAPESYYPELARRLKMKKPFISLKDLTKRDLDRVYRIALRDRKNL